MDTLEIEAEDVIIVDFGDFGLSNGHGQEIDAHDNLQIGEFCATKMTLNPLELPNIIMEVQRGLYLNDLMNFRLVNKTWECEANRFISQIPITLTFESFVRIPYFRFRREDEPDTSTSITITIDPPKTLAALTSAAVSSPSLVQMFKTFVLVDCDPNNLEDWPSFLATFGPHLQSLTIRGREWRADSGSYYFLGNILKNMKNLSTLVLDVGLWRHIKWSETEGYFKLPSLKHLDLVYVGRQFNDHTTYAKNLWLGCPDWMAVNFWSILRNILHSAPNLKLLRTLEDNYIPGPVMTDIFRGAPFQLETLILGNFGAVERLMFDGEAEYIKHENDFFPLLTGNPCVAYLKSVNLPRPDQAVAADWDNLFAWMAPTLEHLDLNRVYSREWVRAVDDPPSRKLPLYRIRFRVAMPALRELWIPLSILGAAAMPSVLPLFPSLKIVTISISENVQFVRRIGEYQLERVLNNFSFISKLSLRFWVNTGATSEDIIGTRELFEALANSNHLQNLKQLDLYNGMRCEDIEVFLDVYDGQSPIAAQRIKILRFKQLFWTSTTALNFKLPKPFTGVENSSLKCFKNLRHFHLGFDVYLEYGGRPRLNRQFLEFFLELPKLDSLKLIDVEIPEDVVHLLEQKFSGFSESSRFYTYIQDSSSECEDDNSEGQLVGVTVEFIRKSVGMLMQLVRRPRRLYKFLRSVGIELARFLLSFVFTAVYFGLLRLIFL